MDRIYDAAQQGLLACVTAGEQEENLTRFLSHLRSDDAWSPEDVRQVEQEIRRLLALGDGQRTRHVLPFPVREEPIAASKSNGTAPNV